MRHPDTSLNSLYLALIALCVLMAFLMGCRAANRSATKSSDQSSALAVPKEAEEDDKSFQSAIAGTAEVVIDAARDEIPDASRDSIAKLTIPGLFVLIASFASRLLFGSWWDALAIGCLATGLSVAATLIAEYPRVVLLIPAGGVVCFLGWAVKKVVEWRRDSKAFAAVATVIEQEDTGPKSAGQKVKDAIAVDREQASIVDKALSRLEKIWKAATEK